MTKSKVSKKTTPKPKVPTIREQLKAYIIEQIPIRTKSVNDTLLELQKRKDIKKPEVSTEDKKDLIVAKIMWNDFCSDNRKGIIKLLAIILNKGEGEEYYEHLSELYDNETDSSLEDEYRELKIHEDEQRYESLTLVKPIHCSNSHDYPLEQIAITIGQGNRAITIKRGEIYSGNNITRHVYDLQIITDEEITAFIESDLFDKYLEKLVKEDSVKLDFYENTMKKELDEI